MRLLIRKAFQREPINRELGGTTVFVKMGSIDMYIMNRNFWGFLANLMLIFQGYDNTSENLSFSTSMTQYEVFTHSAVHTSPD